MSHFIGDFLAVPNSLVGISSHNQLSEYDKNKSKLDSVNRQILQNEIKSGYLSTLKSQEIQHTEAIKAQSLVNNSILELSSKVDMRMRAVSEQMELVNTGLDKLAEIMMIPEFEKERLHYYSEGLKYLKQSFTNIKRYVDALEYFQKAANLNKRDFLVQHEIGKIHLYNSESLDIEKAINALKLSFEYAKDEAPMVGSEVAQHLAFANYLNGDLEGAIKYAEESVALDNTRLEALYICGEAHIVLGNINTGIGILKTLINLDASYIDLIEENKNICEVNEVVVLIESVKKQIESNTFSGDLDSLGSLKTKFGGRVLTEEEQERVDLLHMLKTIGKTIEWYDAFLERWGQEKTNMMVREPYLRIVNKDTNDAEYNELSNEIAEHRMKTITGYVVAAAFVIAVLYTLFN